MNQVHKIKTLDHLLNYWGFSISPHHCKCYLYCKIIVVPLMETIFGTFSASHIEPTDLGTLSTKRYYIFGQCTANYHRTHRKLSLGLDYYSLSLLELAIVQTYLGKKILKNSTLWKFSYWDDSTDLASWFDICIFSTVVRFWKQHCYKYLWRILSRYTK